MRREKQTITYAQFEKAMNAELKKILTKKNKTMCFKRIWESLFGHEETTTVAPKTTEQPTGKKEYTKLYAINNYPGSQNDLNGCLPDQKNVNNFMNKNYSAFISEAFADSKVTRSTFRETIKALFLSLKAGDNVLIHYSGHGTTGIDPHSTEADGYSEALYLYDGAFWDYELKELLDLIPDGAKVVIALDSCFSGGMWKGIDNPRIKARFMPTQELKPDIKKKSGFKTAGKNYIVFAGCQEDQTSADAYIENGYQGAFTYFWLKAWKREFTYQQWVDETVRLIKANGGYDQVPMLNGDVNIMPQVIFE